MKKIFKFSVIVSLCAALISLVSCQKELDVNPLGEDFAFSGMAPNPVMRGGVLRIFGRSLDQVTEVRFAGDVTVTEFENLLQGSKLDTLEVKVPLEGPEVGKVTIVAKDGRELSSMADLSFTEAIEITSFSPATVLSGDILTIKGEYLNVVKEVFFAGDDAVSVAFESQSRHELKVKVPANAITGPVILSDVNEIEDQTTIPNHIYTPSDLIVGDPTVTKAAKKTYKSGDVITVSGAHLDMIKNVALPQVAEVDFTVAEDAASISFNLPPKAADGNITLTSFGGKDFDAGEIETVSVTELTVKSLAEDGRYKAGCEVEITGKDLDLVAKVEFTGAEASWYLTDNKIIATQPAGAKDGAITVTLDSGKQAYSEDIEVVKPVVTGIDKTEAVAGVDTIVVSGTDLDLVASAKIGNKEQSFIDCEFEFGKDENDALVVRVAIPEQAYSGPITLTADSGYETVTDNITVTYDLAVAIKFDSPSFGLGQNISITGKNLLQIEQIFVKSKKVTSYAVRTDTAMSFGIPEGLGPGVYRLAIVLIDGTEITWPIPFEITAPFTETFIWEGSETISWSGMSALSWGGYDWSTVAEGTVLCAHFTLDPSFDYWQIRFGNGSWASLPSLAGLAPEGNIPLEAGMTEYKFELTAEDLNVLVNEGGLVMTGTNYTLTGISLIQFGAAEKRNVIWEGSNTVTWDGGAVTALSWGGYDWSTVQPGTKLSAVYTIDDASGCIRFGNGSWASLPSLAGLAPDGNLPLQEGGYSFELTAEDLAELVNNGGLVVCGTGYTITEIALVTSESGPAVPTGTTIWEGTQLIDWSGNSGEDNKALGALSWGGYDWSTVSAGTTLVIEYEPVADVEAQLRVSNGSWAALPGTEDPYKPTASPFELELTQAMLDELVANGGMVLTGQGMTLTAIILR